MPKIQKLLKLAEVTELTGVTRSTIYRWTKAGHFPQPTKFGPNTCRWYESDIAAWQQKQRRRGHCKRH